MQSSYSKLAIAVFFAGVLLAGPAASAETLKIAGTGGAMPMAERAVADFAASTGIKIEAIPGLGSKGAIKAVADGAIDLAFSARMLNPDEANLGLTIVSMARTALVFVTSEARPNSLKSTELPEIFRSV